jgi:tRNA A37 methylthiotransferase MiaB
MADDRLAAVRNLEKVSPDMHVPTQRGSNRVLKGKKRCCTTRAKQGRNDVA